MWVCAGLCDVDNVLKQIDLLSCFKASQLYYIEESFIFCFVLLETGLWVGVVIDGAMVFRSIYLSKIFLFVVRITLPNEHKRFNDALCSQKVDNEEKRCVRNYSLCILTL